MSLVYGTMEVIKKCYEFTCSLREYVRIHIQDFSASEALEIFMNTSIVACHDKTCLHQKKPFTTTKAGTMDEVLAAAMRNAIAKGNMRDNVLFKGYKRWQPNEHGTCNENDMVTFALGPLFEELHGIIGTDIMLHLINDLVLFVNIQSCYCQVIGNPINENEIECSGSKVETQREVDKIEGQNG